MSGISYGRPDVPKAFANKPGLAKAVFDVAIVGDDNISTGNTLLAGARDTAARPVFAARLAALTGNDPDNYAISPPPGADTDPGWIYNRARQLRRLGAKDAAASLLINRGALSRLPLEGVRVVELAWAFAGPVACIACERA